MPPFIDPKTAFDISLCPNGHTQLRFGTATIHMSLDQFRSLLSQGSKFIQRYERAVEWKSEVHEIRYQN